MVAGSIRGPRRSLEDELEQAARGLLHFRIAGQLPCAPICRSAHGRVGRPAADGRQPPVGGLLDNGALRHQDDALPVAHIQECLGQNSLLPGMALHG